MDPAASTSRVIGLEACEWNSGFCVCWVNTLPDKLHPQPHVFSYKGSEQTLVFQRLLDANQICEKVLHTTSHQ